VRQLVRVFIEDADGRRLAEGFEWWCGGWWQITAPRPAGGIRYVSEHATEGEMLDALRRTPGASRLRMIYRKAVAS